MKIVTALTIFSLAANLRAQVSFVKEFAAIPVLQKTAKASFAASETNFFDGYASYVGVGKMRSVYNDQLLKKMEPYKAIVLAKGNALTAPATQAAIDFSDLNSPETQAKIAAMSQEEKMKFALEVQQRMKDNKNLQTVNNGTKVNSTLLQAQLGVDAAYKKFAAAAQNLKMAHHQLQNTCGNLCGTEAQVTEACAKKITACENKAAHDHMTAEMKNYTDYNTTCQALYTKAKADFLAALAKFDTVAAGLSDSEKAESILATVGYLSGMNDWMGDVEKDGAKVIVEGKNGLYTKTEY